MKRAYVKDGAIPEQFRFTALMVAPSFMVGVRVIRRFARVLADRYVTPGMWGFGPVVGGVVGVAVTEAPMGEDVLVLISGPVEGSRRALQRAGVRCRNGARV